VNDAVSTRFAPGACTTLPRQSGCGRVYDAASTVWLRAREQRCLGQCRSGRVNQRCLDQSPSGRVNNAASTSVAPGAWTTLRRPVSLRAREQRCLDQSHCGRVYDAASTVSLRARP